MKTKKQPKQQPVTFSQLATLQDQISNIESTIVLAADLVKLLKKKRKMYTEVYNEMSAEYAEIVKSKSKRRKGKL